MRIGWYIARLRNMSAAEVTHRFVEKAKKVRARGRLEGWACYDAERAGVGRLPGFAEALKNATPQMRTLVAQSAAAVMGGHFSSLGQDWPRFEISAGSDPIWHLDPVTGQHWPADQYCFDIGYRGARDIGDVKYVWEFSRLQFLQPVAAHAFLSGDAQSVAFIERVVSSWYESNPPFRGVGWSSGIELALRAISLLVVTSLIGERLSEATIAKIAAILRAHAFWLERYPSRFSSANNHLVSEDAALYLLGAACEFLPARQRERLITHGGAAIAREAGLQILADGVPAEQSPTYGALTAELVLLCAFVARQRGAPLPAPTDERLASFAEFVCWLSDDQGRAPPIGDDDEGRVITLVRHETCYPTSVAAAISGFLGRGDLAPTTEPDLRNAIMPAGAPAPAPIGTRSFRDGGYTVHRGPIAGRSAILVMDHAPLGYLSIAAHGHADALAITLELDNKPLIVDPGTYLYHSGHEWRDWFRGTRAHNTLTLGGVDQSTIAGAFNWSHKANAKLDEVQAEPFTARASHDGYEGRFGVRHERRVAVEGGGLTITDRLLGAAAAQVGELVIQLAPDCDAVIAEDGVRLSINGELLATLKMPEAGEVTLTRGGEALDGGWVSPAFGRKLPATRVSWKGAVGAEGVQTRVVVKAP